MGLLVSKRTNMKNKSKKMSVTIGLTFVYLALANFSPVAAIYGSDVVLGTTVHETVNAGIADIIPQALLAGTAVTGMISTAILYKRTK